MQQQQIRCTKITTVQNEHLFITIQSFLLQFWPLNDQITVSFVRAAGVLAKGCMRPAGRMFDMPGLQVLPAYVLKFYCLMSRLQLRGFNLEYGGSTLFRSTIHLINLRSVTTQIPVF